MQFALKIPTVLRTHLLVFIGYSTMLFIPVHTSAELERVCGYYAWCIILQLIVCGYNAQQEHSRRLWYSIAGICVFTFGLSACITKLSTAPESIRIAPIQRTK